MKKVLDFFQRGFRSFFKSGEKGGLAVMLIASFILGFLFTVFRFEENIFTLFYLIFLPSMLAWFIYHLVKIIKDNKKNNL